ncbi:hypothetical protein PTKIN_Ptkin02bG0200200 [Pterospermum kingtungense]
MEIKTTDHTPSLPQNIEVRNCSLNPEAPEFFPSQKAIVSAPNRPIFPPTNPFFLHYPTLPCLHPHVFSVPIFSHPSYPYYPHQHAGQTQTHFLAPEKAVAGLPVTEPVSLLLESFKAEMVLEEAQEPRIVARKEKMEGTRKSNKDMRRGKRRRYGKERVYNTQEHRKKWRAKANPSNYGTADNEYFAGNVDQDRAGKVDQDRAGSKREKHPPIPLKEGGNETTVMLRNIPNRYTRRMLMDFLDLHCMTANKEAESQNVNGADEETPFSAFDFLYLPIDFMTKSNKGFAFINFKNPGAARKFFDAWHRKHWDCFQSNKIREVYCAKLQGVEQLVKHFERMEFPRENFQPLVFNPARDGSKQLVKETLVGRCTSSDV